MLDIFAIICYTDFGVNNMGNKKKGKTYWGTWFDTNFLNKIRAQAIKENRNLPMFIREAIIEYLYSKEKEENAKRSI